MLIPELLEVVEQAQDARSERVHGLEVAAAGEVFLQLDNEPQGPVGDEDAVVVVGSDQKVTYWNGVAEGLYGIPADQAIGRKLEDLYRSAWSNPDDERDFTENLATKGHWTGENIHVKKNGKKVQVRSSVSMMRSADGAQTGMVAVIRDRTKLWQAEEEMKLLNG